ncbi:MAG TPA: chemotaxis protein CheX [Gammaproteobacteria bacterium]|nr:chemotaxis protein CheX [Gammaproteobacteria bacterium]
MNVTFINPFIRAIQDTLSTMAGLEATPGAPSIKEDTTAKGDVTGIIGMAGPQLTGSLAVCFTEAVIVEISRRMLGETPQAIDESVTDMVGELTNIVTGGAKKLLADDGYDFDMAIPAVVAGKGHTIEHKSSGATLILPFDTEAGPFFMEICFVER